MSTRKVSPTSTAPFCSQVVIKLVIRSESVGRRDPVRDAQERAGWHIQGIRGEQV